MALKFDTKRMKAVLTVEDDDGVEVEHCLPAKYEICEACRGTGRRDHPAFRNGITGSEMAEWDGEDVESYFAGRYDVDCEECSNGKALVIDEGRILDQDGNPSPEFKAAWEAYDAWTSDEAEYQSVCAAERRMGA